ncbi:uncharacterized protein LOC118468921 [Anopheles albimanus]|uniref:Uncharacterized protein n=1 Tax=Anopheles albimanus TaxID=7167 RepID=A0A182FQC8_ANOAL|nr:uncharacterized protein LOC118468921 [Anopheles albimanus]
MFMDDSGIESGDKLESLFVDELGSFVEHEPQHTKDTMPTAVTVGGVDSDAESDIFSKLNDFDVVFENPNEKSRREDPIRAAVVSASAPVTDSDPYATNRSGFHSTRKVLSSDNSTDSYASSTVATASATGSVPSGLALEDKSQRDHGSGAQLSTCKILQRKLELKVERAKRNYRQMYHTEQEPHEKEPQISSLIPISRLPIPGGRDNQQLIDVNTGFNSDDDLENVSFFPRHQRKLSGPQVRQELSDTFSIQEMTIESDNEDLDFAQCRKLSDSKGYRKILNRSPGVTGPDDYLDNDTLDEDDDSQNLELLAPKGGYALKERLRRLFCCCKHNDFL